MQSRLVVQLALGSSSSPALRLQTCVPMVIFLCGLWLSNPYLQYWLSHVSTLEGHSCLLILNRISASCVFWLHLMIAQGLQKLDYFLEITQWDLSISLDPEILCFFFLWCSVLLVWHWALELHLSAHWSVLATRCPVTSSSNLAVMDRGLTSCWRGELGSRSNWPLLARGWCHTSLLATMEPVVFPSIQWRLCIK